MFKVGEVSSGVEEEFPFEEIQKRDGRVVTFDPEKITQAIFQAARAVGGEDYQLAREVTREVVKYLAAQKLPGLIPTVEEIQDVVEKVLIERGHARTAKAYILYRDKRTRIRENKSELMDVVRDILVEGKKNDEGAAGTEVEVKHSPAGKMQQIAEAASDKYYLENLLPAEIADAHREGSIHIHSLSHYSKSLESLQLDLKRLNLEGVDSRNEKTDLLSNPLNPLFELAALLQKNQNDILGEQALLSFDAFLGELARETRRNGGSEKYWSCIEALLSYLDQLHSLRENREEGALYSFHIGLDCSEEGRAMTSLLLNDILNGKVKMQRKCRLVFPLREGVNFSQADPNYDIFKLALKSALRFGNPFFSIQDDPIKSSSGELASCFSSGRIIGTNRHGAPGGYGRGEIASLTVNLPRLALHSGNEALFLVELDRLLRLGVRQLLHRFEVLTALSREDLPFVMGRGLYEHSRTLSPGESIIRALKSGAMYVSFIGLPEAARVLTGGKREGEKNEEAVYLAARITEHMGKRIKSYADEYDLNIFLSGAAGNGGLLHLTQKDRADFGLVKGINDKDFYSPSLMLFEEDDGFEKKVDLEGKIHGFCTGGYRSRALLLPGTDLHSAEELLRRTASAGVRFLHINPVNR